MAPAPLAAVNHLQSFPVDVLRLPARDLFDWLSLAASLLVAPIVAVFAARFGAVVGGREAHTAAVAVHKLEVEDARRMQREDKDAADVHQRRLLIRRIRGDVRRFEAIPRSLETANRIDAIMPAAADTLEVACEGLARRRDDLHLLGDEQFEEEVEFFYDKLLSIRGWLRKWHEQELTMEAKQIPSDEIDSRVTFQAKSLRATLPLGEEIVERLHKDWPTS